MTPAQIPAFKSRAPSSGMKDTQIDPDVLLSLPFDHYQRYSLTRRMVSSTCANGSSGELAARL